MAKRKKTGETSNHPPPPPQKVIGGEDTCNPPPQKVIGGEDTCNPPPTGGREENTVTIDTDLLDCSICTNPLYRPIYQCMNGHVVCPSCWSKVQHKCHICKVPGVTRNIALEKIVKATHIPCTSANLGCRKSVSYSRKKVHADNCDFGPSLCPIPGCAHKAISGEWWEHFRKEHKDPSIFFYYDQICSVQIQEVDPYYTLIGPGKVMFLLVKESIPNAGNTLSLYYIDLHHMDKKEYSCTLKVVGRENYITSSVEFYSEAVVPIREWKRGEVRGNSLLVPLRFSSSQYIKVNVHVLIHKIARRPEEKEDEEEVEEEEDEEEEKEEEEQG